MIILFYLIWLILGLVVGLFIHSLSIFFITKRSGSLENNILLNARYSAQSFAVLNGAVWLGSILGFGLKPLTLEFLIMFSICSVLSVVDISIRKIPNEILLLLLVASIIFLVVNNDFGNIMDRLVGIAVSVVVFLLPSIVGKGAGAGDIKLAGVVGFCLGVHDMLEAYIFMLIPLLIYTAYVYITKKGNIKTKVALGFFMSVGYIMVFALRLFGFSF